MPNSLKSLVRTRPFLITAASSAVLVASFAGWGWQISRQIGEIESRHAAFQDQSQSRVEAAFLLQHNQGYGAFIHNFKNYVLRGDETYLESARQNLVEINQALDSLLTNASEEEIVSIEIIRAVFAKYAVNLEAVVELRRQGYSTTDIDQAVRVNDHPAVEAEAVIMNDILTEAREFTSQLSNSLEETRQWIVIAFLLFVPALAGVMLILTTQIRLLRDVHKASFDATHDPLTGLMNRRALFSWGHRLVGSDDCDRLCVAVIDIDDYKRINDEFGHAGGDYVLVKLASLFKERLSGIGHVARYGGDEFVVLLPGFSGHEAEEAMEDLRKSVDSIDLVLRNRRIATTISIGITSQLVVSFEKMIGHADEALYTAKQSGKNRVVTSDGIDRVSPKLAVKPSCLNLGQASHTVH